jgi:hypothetical protein
MKRKISGDELRARLLSRMKPLDSEPTEGMRIEALSSSGNRELLGIIATQQPRSISELATLAGRLQPNVSRSLNALARAGLLTVVLDGRASVPTLTREGQRKAEDLGFHAREPASWAQAETPPSSTETPALSVTISGAADGNLESETVEANVVVRFPMRERSPAIEAHALLNLNEVCTNLLANWWRILCRRDDPYKMFPVARESDQGISPAILLAKSLGRIELIVRSSPEEQALWGSPRLSLTAEKFTTLVLNELVHPLVHRLHAGKWFDRPAESMLRRTEEILGNPTDLTFWKSAGALGLSYRSMNDAAAADVDVLVEAISNEDARLDFASTIDPAQLRQTLSWVTDELNKKAKTNALARLTELRTGVSIDIFSGVEPWRIGKDRAREARNQIGLAEDRPVGEIGGIARIFSGDDHFVASSAGEEPLRGFQGFRSDEPVVIVKNEGPHSTAFLMSRAIGDYLVYGSREAPIANIYTDRQAVGRAFAAEFMAPGRAVVQMIDREKIPLAKVANHYGVEREVISHQYENSIAQYAV